MPHEQLVNAGNVRFGSVWNGSFEPGLNLVSGSHRFGSEPVRSEPIAGFIILEVSSLLE